MIIYNNLKLLNNSIEFKPIQIALGNFDGIHLGHRRLIEAVVHSSEQRGNIPAVLTFDPHPQQFFAKLASFEKIDTPSIQAEILEQLGVKALAILPFNKELAEQSAEDFCKFTLGALNLKGVFVGENFRFGKARGGDVSLLKKIGQSSGFQVTEVAMTQDEGELVSSSRLRKLLSVEGNVKAAKQLLSRPFRIQGFVVKGQQLGRVLGFPTANLGGITQLKPKSGVYAGFLRSRTLETNSWGERRAAVINVGTRPTVTNEAKLVIEAHVYEPTKDLNLYDQFVDLEFHRRLRDEIKFESVEHLKAQICLDIEQAKQR